MVTCPTFDVSYLRNDTVEGATLVSQGLARLSDTLLASAQRAEVLNGFRNSVAVQPDHNTACDKMCETTDQPCK